MSHMQPSKIRTGLTLVLRRSLIYKLVEVAQNVGTLLDPWQGLIAGLVREVGICHAFRLGFFFVAGMAMPFSTGKPEIRGLFLSESSNWSI